MGCGNLMGRAECPIKSVRAANGIMQDYLLLEGFLGGATIKIDEIRFNNLINSNEAIKQIWDTEDAFSILANSFIELEELGFKFQVQRLI